MTLFGCSEQDVKEEVCIAAVHKAFELGINFFDTSPHYGETKSEKVQLIA